MRIFIAVVALGIASTPAPQRRSADSETAQVASIRAHFDSVFVEMAAADTAGLDIGQRSRRARLVQRLRGYRDAGIFPHNYDFAVPTPQFIDRKTGTRCAMAFLLESTGERDLVARIARADNAVRIKQLGADTALGAWLDRNGLTLAEAARIQPMYDGPDPIVIPPRKPLTPVRVAPITLGVTAASLWLNALNDNPDGTSALTGLGYVSGTASVLVGFMALADMADESRGREALGVSNVVAGAASVVLSSIIRTRRNDNLAAKTTVSVAPILPTAKSGSGLAVALRF